ncbi:MAG: DUF2103 domain-containing protein [Syntrophobacteraceae bacterium]|jgi:hypothetical protein
MKQGHRSGGKYVASHTTLIPAAATLADIAEKQPEVKKIALGFIKAGLPSVGGKRRAKITEHPSNLFISVRDNTSTQMMVLYTADTEKTKRTIYRGGKKFGIEVSFVKSTDETKR